MNLTKLNTKLIDVCNSRTRCASEPCELDVINSVVFAFTVVRASKVVDLSPFVLDMSTLTRRVPPTKSRQSLCCAVDEFTFKYYPITKEVSFTHPLTGNTVRYDLLAFHEASSRGNHGVIEIRIGEDAFAIPSSAVQSVVPQLPWGGE